MAENNEAPDSPQKPESETTAEEVSAEEPVIVQEEKPSEELSKDARMWAMICHLAGLLINIVSPSNMRKNQPKWKGTGNVILC